MEREKAVKIPVAHMSRGELEEELSAYRALDEEQRAQYDAVVEMCEHPPAPTPLLVRLMKEVEKWHPAPPAVIVTCRDCAYVNDDDQDPTCGHPGSAGAGDEIISLYEAPPHDCPLRVRRVRPIEGPP